MSYKNLSDFQITEDTHAPTLPHISRIALNNVSAGYGDHLVLEGVDMLVESGDVVGIMGDNGAGKTTLSKTLLGLIPHQSGTIQMNQDDIEDWKGQDYLNRIGYFSSDLFLYNHSVKNNIEFNIYGEHTTDQDLEASSMNQLDDHYLLYSNGINISMGQRQKILLDRVFYQDKDVYLLDEPSNSLDLESKERLIERVDELKKQGKLVIVISHDQDLLAHCNKLYQLRHGHLSLMKEGCHE